MQETKEKCDALIREFVENYMGKLFYFCLKKTGDQTRAEDLTQDIALVILTALRKGTVPETFRRGSGRSHATAMRHGPKKSTAKAEC